MRRAALLLPVIVMVLMTSCGKDPDAGAAKNATPDGRASTVTKSGVYEVGADIRPGVYTTDDDPDCVAFAATTAEFDLNDLSADPDAFLSKGMAVGDQKRIELHDGEFFHVQFCDATWSRENSGEVASNDPATLEGGCAILLGEDDLVKAALTFPKKNESSEDRDRRADIQQRLFTIVAANNETLSGPAGQLVDFLDNPAAYVTDGELGDDVAGAAVVIREACDDA